VNGCTIIARNYLAQARVLAETFRDHHPDGRFFALVIDADGRVVSGAREPFELVTPADLPFGDREYERMAAIYDVQELSTAVKPTFLRQLLAAGLGDVAYFDPDIAVYAPLHEISVLVREQGIVLTPHVTAPMPRDGRPPGEHTILAAGIYNLGFIAVSDGAGEFLDWWGERLRRDCILAPERGTSFVDQRWVDFVPALYDPWILRDETYNVAYWNLTDRQVTRNGGRWLVNGKPLRFFHFSAYDPRAPYLLSKHQGATPRILLSEEPELTELCREYGDRLLERGYALSIEQPYGFDALPSGMRVDRRMRRLYREALLAAEEGQGVEPPNPFIDPEAFVSWLREPPDSHGQATRISRYLHAARAERPDLVARFHDLRWIDGDRFVDWVALEGQGELGIPHELAPEARAVAVEEETPESEPKSGVNVAGYLEAELGVGEAGRKVLSTVEHAGLPYVAVNYSATSSRQQHQLDERHTGDPVYDTNIICVNADRLPDFTYEAGPAFFRNRYSIGVWWWEIADFPDSLHESFKIVDEIWVGSRFVADSIGAATDKPVKVFPVPIEVPKAEPLDRVALGLPDGFLFLFAFDFFSVLERKNPLGLIEAFSRAFEPGEGPVLMLKSINGDKQLVELERLRAAAARRPDIHLVDRYVTAAEKNSLMAGCDCYVSLHRSEGFGLTLAEAMAYGRPAIATAYSGNVDFMHEENSYLVPYREGRIPQSAEPYPAGSPWADPDIDEAARILRHVYENQAEAEEIGRRGRAEILSDRSVENASGFIRKRLDEISEQRRRVPPVSRAEPVPESASEIEHAWRFLSDGPEVPLQAESRFGFAGVLGRRILYRLLRPYMFRQREWEVAVVKALRQVEANAHAEAREAAAVERRLAKTLFRASDQLDRASRRLVPRQSEIDSNLSELVDRVSSNEDSLDRLDSEAHPSFFVEPGLLSLIEGDKGSTIGYSNGRPGTDPDDVYTGFEAVFRGPESRVTDLQRVYLGLLGNRAPVLDFGCGRGEFLDLLAEGGVPARGVDIDAAMVERAREKGHEVEHADGIEYLAAQPDATFGVIFAAQVIEHLPYQQLLEFLTLAEKKLKPGGLLISETVNPHPLSAFKAFWLDLTHERPIYPEVAITLCRLHGFGSARVFFPTGTGDYETDKLEQPAYAVVASSADQ
jgi:glycosyltransferase involved in cell wall biosynthesis/SAM-dependent methyltransferase